MKSSLLGLLVLLGGSSLFGEDFTFNIPYSAHSLPPEVQIMRITCRVYDAKGEVIATGDKDIAIPWGGHTGDRTVQLKFNAHPGKKADSAVRYVCSLWDPLGKSITLDPAETSKLVAIGEIKR
jgi:hypothetical protein